jgi:hypothetical protein
LLKLIDKGDTNAVVQRYKVSKNKDIICPIVLSLSSKVKYQKRHVGTIPNRNTPLPAKGPPIVIINSGSHIAMKKKVVHGLPIPLGHASVHHDDVPPPKIIQGEDLA